MGVPDGDAPAPSPLQRLVEDQALAVLAGVDDLRLDLRGSVHDARVALRKLRSTLAVFGPLLDPAISGPLAAELRWFAGELSPARDAQVVRSRVTSAIRSASGRDPGGADRDVDGTDLLTELDASAAPDWERAAAALSDPRLDALVVALGRIRLGMPAGTADRATLRDRVSAGLGVLLQRARTTLAETDDQRLHQLRKRVKRVRFAVASLRDSAVDALPAGSGAGRVVHALEELQDLLGEYQDAVVTAGILDRIGSEVPRLADLAAELSEAQRKSAAEVRAALPAGVERVRRAARRLRGRSPGVHLDSP